jgi:catechol 2,3-dioxygenase-like lactoylglutathione lyase family enzyme
MKALQLHHASIRVNDVARSRRFYEQLLGLEPIERPDLGMPGVWYGIGAGQLHLIECAPTGLPIDPTGPHFAVQVADLDAARREIAAAGLEVLDPGRDQLWVRDPDGNVVEITAAPPPKPPPASG